MDIPYTQVIGVVKQLRQETGCPTGVYIFANSCDLWTSYEQCRSMMFNGFMNPCHIYISLHIYHIFTLLQFNITSWTKKF